MKREIVLDTETTGLRPQEGHRLVEIAALELENHVPTGRTYHTYINPERDVPTAATNVHGLTENFLKDFSCFDKIYQDFLNFIEDATLVIHNAPFDMGFLNHALSEYDQPALPNPVVDTLKMARSMFPGSPASLDALCRRYKVDLSARDYHGALIDCELLAAVYLEMKGGRQQGLHLGGEKTGHRGSHGNAQDLVAHYRGRTAQAPRLFSVDSAEEKAHQAFRRDKLKSK